MDENNPRKPPLSASDSSTKIGHSNMPLTPKYNDSMQHSLASFDLVSANAEDATPSPFQEAVTDLISIAHKILDFNVQELLESTKCKTIIGHILNLQEQWNNSWPCREHLIRILIVFASVARLIEHLQENPKAFSGSGSSAGNAKPLKIAKPEADASGLGIDLMSSSLYRNRDGDIAEATDNDDFNSWTESGTEANDSGTGATSVHSDSSRSLMQGSTLFTSFNHKKIKKKTRNNISRPKVDHNRHQVQVLSHPKSLSVDNSDADPIFNNLSGNYSHYSSPLNIHSEHNSGVVESLQKLKEAVDEAQAVNILIELSLDGVVAYVSPTVRHVFGYDPKECLTTPQHNNHFLPPGCKDPSIFRDAVNALSADDRVTIEVTYQAQTSDGKWLEMEGKVIFLYSWKISVLINFAREC